MRRVNDYLEIAGEGPEAVIRCQCGHVLCAATENYKEHALLREGPVQQAGPWVDPHGLGGDQFVCREFFCPGCVAVLNVETAQRTDPIMWDTQVLPT